MLPSILPSPTLLTPMWANLVFQKSYWTVHSPVVQRIPSQQALIVQSRTIPGPSFNYILQAHFTSSEIESAIAQCSHLFHSIPFIWWVMPGDVPNDIGTYLIKAGFIPQEEEWMMARSIGEDVSQLSTHPLQVSRVISPNEMALFASILQDSGEIAAAASQFFTPLPIASYGVTAPYEFYVGYYKQQPVCVSQLVVHAGIAGIYSLTTHPNHRQRGYGRAMVHFLLQRARQLGVRFVTLHATKEQKALYCSCDFHLLLPLHKYASA